MGIDSKLLEILVCPVTKQSVSLLAERKLASLNQLIAEGKVENHGGRTLEASLQQALVTQNGGTLYPVEQNIPVMLEDESIDTVQLGDW